MVVVLEIHNQYRIIELAVAEVDLHKLVLNLQQEKEQKYFLLKHYLNHQFLRLVEQEKSQVVEVEVLTLQKVEVLVILILHPQQELTDLVAEEDHVIMVVTLGQRS